MSKRALPILALTLAASGCSKPVAPATPAPARPSVAIGHAERRDIGRTVGQPGFVEAYEQAALYAKVSGYIEKWNVDIGDIVKKDQVLATIFVPELVEEHRVKQATVELDTVLVEQARKVSDAADGDLKAAVAKVAQAKADVGRYSAEVERWQSEVKRLTGLVQQNVVDRQVLGESTRQLKSNEASRDAALSAVAVAEAQRLASDADLAKAKVDIRAAETRVLVAKAEERRLAALVGYLKLTAPFDGIITIRNANTGDFVTAASGDQSASASSPGQSATRGTPIYSIARLDKVRVFVDVPESDTRYVTVGTPAAVRFESLANLRVPSNVARTSWALNVRSRTLRAEIDLPNEGARFLPGMYVYGYVEIKREKVMAVPSKAIAKRGDMFVVFILQDGKAVQTEARLGASDGDWTEVVSLSAAGTVIPLTPETGIILGNSEELADGTPVEVVQGAKSE